MKYCCDNCSRTGDPDTFDEVQDVMERMTPGYPFTDKQCPDCCALAYPVDCDAPESTIKTMFVCFYTHRHGHDITVHWTAEAAAETARNIMRNNEDEMGPDPEVPRLEDGEIDFSKIEPEEWGDLTDCQEFLEVFPTQVCGTINAHGSRQ